MITRFISEVSTRFNPFSATAKTARLFLTRLPPGARAQGMSITTKLLPRDSTEPSSLVIKFKDGNEMKLDVDTMNIKNVVEVVDRHSRQLQKAADLE